MPLFGIKRSQYPFFSDEWNVHTVSNNICEKLLEKYAEPSTFVIEKAINESVIIDECTLYLKQDDNIILHAVSTKPDYKVYIWVSALLLGAALVFIILVRYYMTRKKGRSRMTFQIGKDELLIAGAKSPGSGDTKLPINSLTLPKG